MGINNLRPFATSADANVMTDEQLASAPELQSGFIVKSKADSKLVGKLFQDTSAAAYAVGAFTAKHSEHDVSGTNPEQLASDFEAAITEVASSGSSVLVTKEQFEQYKSEVTAALETKVDDDTLTSYAPLQSPTFTGTVTVPETPTNNTDAASKKYVDDSVAAVKIDLSNYRGDSVLVAAPGDGEVGASLVIDPTSSKLTSADNSIVVNQTGTTITGPVTIEQPQSDNNPSTKKYVDDAVTDLVHTSTLSNYVPTTGGTITGDLTVNGTINGTLNGAATKATQDGDGNVISATYVKTSTLDGYLNKTSGGTISGPVEFEQKVTVPEPTELSDAVTKQYVDNRISAVYRYAGSVASIGLLPQSDNDIGDVYNVESDNMNYVWDGAKWDSLGSTVDLSSYLTKNDASSMYLTKSDATSTYLTKTDATKTYLATSTAESKYLTKNEASTTYAQSSTLANYVTTETANSTYLSKSDASSTYLTKTDAESTYVTEADLNLDNYVTVTDAQSTYLTKSDASTTYVTKEGLQDELQDIDLTKYVPISGDINAVTYNQKNFAASGSSLTLAKDSPEMISIELNGAFTVSCTGAADVNRTIKLHIHKAAASTGSIAWNDVTEWLSDGGSAPTFGTSSDEQTLIVAICISGTTILGNTLHNSENGVTGGDVNVDDVTGLTDKLNDYALKTDLNAYATTASLSSYATKTELGNYATTSSLSSYAQKTELNNYVPKTGEIDPVTFNQKNHTETGSTVTINKSSADMIYVELSGAKTITCTGAADANRTIKVHIHKAASATGSIAWNGVTEWLTDGGNAPTFGSDSAEHNLIVAVCISNTTVLANTLHNSENGVTGGDIAISQVTGLQQTLDETASKTELNAKINLSGSRGQLAGYETVTSTSNVTVTNTSADSIEASGTVTVNNGASGQCWTKVVHCTNASPSVTLGTNWHWQNASQPELKQNGFLVLCWCSSMGLAIYNNVQ